jgi:prepilin-type N-terminal cleavage/methylation domain-containing protein
MYLRFTGIRQCRSRSHPPQVATRGIFGFTLVEVSVCMAILAVVFGGIITCYMQGADRAEWAGYNLSAQALAMQQVEQAKAAKWDSTVNEITNIVRITSASLDLPMSGTNQIWATNYTSVTQVQISASPLIYVQMVKVDTQWPFYHRGSSRYFTNSVACYYAKDQ